MPSFGPWQLNMPPFLHNHLLNLHSGLSPNEIFTWTHWPHSKFHDLHVWSCAVSVPEKTIQDGKKISCWHPRSEHCVNMGLSKQHASSIPLVLHLSTGTITLLLMNGLPPLLPGLMIFLTSPVPTGPSSLVNLTISTLSMMMMFTKWKWKKLPPWLPISMLLHMMKLSLMPSTPLHQYHYQLVHHLPFNLFNRGSHQP